MKKTFNTIVKDLVSKNQLKTIKDDIVLPYVFDLYWDIKYGYQLKEYKENADVKRLLAENGYDVNSWLKVFNLENNHER